MAQKMLGGKVVTVGNGSGLGTSICNTFVVYNQMHSSAIELYVPFMWITSMIYRRIIDAVEQDLFGGFHSDKLIFV